MSKEAFETGYIDPRQLSYEYIKTLLNIAISSPTCEIVIEKPPGTELGDDDLIDVLLDSLDFNERAETYTLDPKGILDIDERDGIGSFTQIDPTGLFVGGPNEPPRWIPAEKWTLSGYLKEYELADFREENPLRQDLFTEITGELAAFIFHAFENPESQIDFL